MSEPRSRCLECLRPESTCVCALLPRIETKTRVLILQHPRERLVAIGTAGIAHRSLAGSTLRVGVDFSRDPAVAAALDGGARLLWPGSDALAVEELSSCEPITLVVVDGTWPNARKIVRRNPALAALPQLRFTPPRPSEYRIRREPAAHCVATLEALVHVLGILEHDPERFEPMLRPFRVMVEAQLRHRHLVPRRSGRPRKAIVPAALATAGARLVCVHGEAVAWPAGHPDAHAPEIVQWLAVRPATGDRFDAIVTPRRPVPPTLPGHLGIDLDSGVSLESFAESWGRFARPDDVLCSWRSWSLGVLEREVPLSSVDRVDLRPIASRLVHGPPGSVDDCLERLGGAATAPWAPGRGGRRVAALEAITRLVLARG